MNIYNQNYYLDFHNSELEKLKSDFSVKLSLYNDILAFYPDVAKHLNSLKESNSIEDLKHINENIDNYLKQLVALDEFAKFNEVIFEDELQKNIQEFKATYKTALSLNTINSAYNSAKSLIDKNELTKTLKLKEAQRKINELKTKEVEDLRLKAEAELKTQQSIENQKKAELDNQKSIEETEKFRTTQSNNEKFIQLEKLKLEKLKELNLKVEAELKTQQAIENQKNAESEKQKSLEKAAYIELEKAKVTKATTENEKLKLEKSLELKKYLVKELELSKNTNWTKILTPIASVIAVLIVIAVIVWLVSLAWIHLPWWALILIAIVVIVILFAIFGD